MPSVKFTKNFIKSIKDLNKRITYYDTEISGLALRVSPSGTKTYSIIYRNSNRIQKRYTIGKDPIYSLTEARLEAKKLLAQTAHRIDIQTEKSKKVISHTKITVLHVTITRLVN